MRAITQAGCAILWSWTHGSEYLPNAALQTMLVLAFSYFVYIILNYLQVGGVACAQPGPPPRRHAAQFSRVCLAHSIISTSPSTTWSLASGARAL